MAADTRFVRQLINRLFPDEATRPLLVGPAISYTGDAFGRCGYSQTPEEVVSFFERFVALAAADLDAIN